MAGIPCAGDVKITDLGWAKKINPSIKDHTKAGTLVYWAPEMWVQAARQRSADTQAGEKTHALDLSDLDLHLVQTLHAQMSLMDICSYGFFVLDFLGCVHGSWRV